MLACGSESAPSALPPAPVPPERTPGGPPLAPTSTWSDLPAGFEPIELPRTIDTCDGFVVWVGVDAVTVTRREPIAFPLPEPTATGVEGDVARAMGPPLLLLSGAYNGPGGEPLFRWYLESTRVILVFDRRVDRARFAGALRAARDITTVRLGGVDAHGVARCTLAASRAPEEMGAQRENRTFLGRVEPDGTLVVAHDPADVRLASDVDPAALPGEAPSGLHMVRLELVGDAPVSAFVRAAALARWADRRYAYFEVGPP